MWEIWRPMKKFKAYMPTAWFNAEEEAREYAEYLATVGISAEVHYNDRAIFEDYSANPEWMRANENIA